MRDGLAAGTCGGILSAPEPMNAISDTTWHQPVMAREVLAFLNPQPGRVIVDGTTGTAGHSLLLLPRLLPDGRLIAVDRDREALDAAQDRLREFAPVVTFVHENYRNLPAILSRLGITRVDGFLLDLGMSSPQVDRPERGFSFSKDGPLDMRMDPHGEEQTAETLVNRSTAEDLAMLFERFGEERFAARIARHLVQERRRRPILSTTQLARLVTEAVPSGARRGRLHPATRVFQALRMAVNDELGALEDTLSNLAAWLKPGGRAVILSYHSLEDRLVKRAFAVGALEGRWTVLTKKPARPSAEETARNPRARSAKLRAIERAGGR